MPFPLRSKYHMHRHCSLQLTGQRVAARLVVRAAPEPQPEQTQPKTATSAKERVYVPLGQLVTTTVVKQYKQLVDGGLSAEAALAVMENNEYVVTGRVAELRDELHAIGTKLEGRKELLETKLDKQAEKLDTVQAWLYALLGLFVVGLTLVNADTLPSTISGAIFRKLVGG